MCVEQFYWISHTRPRLLLIKIGHDIAQRQFDSVPGAQRWAGSLLSGCCEERCYDCLYLLPTWSILLESFPQSEMCWLESIYSFMVPVIFFLQITLPAEGITMYLLQGSLVHVPVPCGLLCPWCVLACTPSVHSVCVCSVCVYLRSDFLGLCQFWVWSSIFLLLFNFYVTDTAYILSWHC